MTPHQTQQRGIEAQRIIDSEVFAEALRMLDAQIVQQWKDTPVTDQQQQLLLLQLSKSKDKFVAILHGLIATGSIATRQINIDSERNESKARQFFRRVA